MTEVETHLAEISRKLGELSMNVATLTTTIAGKSDQHIINAPYDENTKRLAEALELFIKVLKAHPGIFLTEVL